MLNWLRNVSQNKSTNQYELCYAIDGAAVCMLDIVDNTVKNSEKFRRNVAKTKMWVRCGS